MKRLRPKRALRSMVRWGRNLRGRLVHRLDGPILVFQMGKVGSSAVHRALDESGLGVPIHQVHLLNDLDEIEHGVRRLYVNPVDTLREIERGRQLRRALDSEPGRLWDVVTLVRDPVARNISAFFQSIEEILPTLRRAVEEGKAEPDLLLDIFLERFDHNAPTDWFDTQLKPVFDLDVFDSLFPHQEGYQILEGGRARLLILRTADLSRCFLAAFDEFLGVAVKQLLPVNNAVPKWYGPLYQQFVANVRLPDEYVTRLYESKMARHFFTSDELQRFHDTWVSRGTDEVSATETRRIEP